MALTDRVGAIVRGRPGIYGIYARNLTTDETIDVDADRVMPTESAAKTFVLLHYRRLVTAGVVDPTRRVTLSETPISLGNRCLALPPSRPRSDAR